MHRNYTLGMTMGRFSPGEQAKWGEIALTLPVVTGLAAFPG
jgi:hypothetical protein